MKYEIRYANGHVEIYLDNRFYASADTKEEAYAILEER